MTAPLQRKRLKVGLVGSEHGEEGEYVVDLLLGDQLRAELEGKRNHIDAVRVPLHLTGLFGWAAMVRAGHFSGKWAAFQEVCAYVEDVKGGDEDVDPTRTGQSSDSPSSSPADSPEHTPTGG